MRSLFLFNPSDLFSSTPGGVQRCTREFLEVVQNISADVTLVEVGIDRRWKARGLRWVGMSPYSLYSPDSYISQLFEVPSKNVDAIFLNKAELLRFVPAIRSRASNIPIVLLSHGNESGDALLEFFVHARSNSWLGRMRRELLFGKLIAFEARIRAEYDFKVCTLSAEERIIERWLGAKDSFFLPRRITCDFVPWTPQPGRLGYIGTLNHSPNIMALRAVLETMRAGAVNAVVEIIGGPESVGSQLESDYPDIARYCGPLSDAQARAIMGNWTLALNPIFWLSRGASMKLAHLLGWGLPTLTSPSGRRGYSIPDGLVLESEDSPSSFVGTIVDALKDPDRLLRLRNSLEARMDEFSSNNLNCAFRDWVLQAPVCGSQLSE